jgi:hypothetical protein
VELSVLNLLALVSVLNGIRNAEWISKQLTEQRMLQRWMTLAGFAYFVVHENVLELVPNILHQYFKLSVSKPVRSKAFCSC